MFIGHDSPSSAATMAAAAAAAVCVSLQIQYTKRHNTTRHDKVFETIIVFLFSHSLDLLFDIRKSVCRFFFSLLVSFHCCV